jgi:hypothetical protein
LKDDAGKGIEDHPVVFVSYRDAMRFAGWLGMRLPTEVEWTRAARGDGNHVWPWGANKNSATSSASRSSTSCCPRSAATSSLPVGTVAFATGPFGHVDMTGQVWETFRTRFAPISGLGRRGGGSACKGEDRAGTAGAAAVARRPLIVKGGSYCRRAIRSSSTSIPHQSEIANLLDSVGFRLAKSLKPGYDQLFSLIHTDYNRDQFAVAQEPDLDNQIGIERYVLDAKGFPDEYHAVSFAPVNWLSDDKGVQVAKLEERSQLRPVLLGTLSSTGKLVQPALDAGIYSVSYRNKGMPKELTAAIKPASRWCRPSSSARTRTRAPPSRPTSPPRKTTSRRSGRRCSRASA